MPTRKEVYEAIDRERDYQDEKWGSIEENHHYIARWLMICADELYEASMADSVKNKEEVLKEILQMVSVGIACLEQHGIVEREGIKED
ncbi:MAG: hypothetical protein ACOCT9_00355 [archaeon]